jgi:Methyl-accepting chemotaxis protein
MNTLGERLEFLDISQEDCALLHSFKKTLETRIDGLLDKFYEKLLSTPELAPLFKNAAHIEHAKAAQRGHWMRLFSAQFDEGYYQSVRDIGRAHSRIGLQPRWYIGGYAMVLGELLAAASECCPPGLLARRHTPELVKLHSAITRLVMLDIDLALSVYLDEEKAVHDRFVERIGTEFTGSVLGIVDELVHEAEHIGGEATELHKAAESAGTQARTVAEASEGTNANVQMVAAAVEEMSVSIREISSHLSNQVTISAQALNDGHQADRHAKSLTECAARIGEAVGLISDIAAQTNLLALNATIEAARAGDSGKGFAVVANEVKALANQVARTTNDIRTLVDEVRSVASSTADAIQAVTGTIAEMDHATGAIAAAVEEQSAATRTIAENVHEAARSTQTVTVTINEVRDIVVLTERCADNTKLGMDVLAGRATRLHGHVNQFVQQLRA